jgi:hypothetical protein
MLLNAFIAEKKIEILILHKKVCNHTANTSF